MDVQRHLVGREPELTRIQQHLSAAAASQGSGLLLVGEPGIGKSAVVEAASSIAQDRGFTLVICAGVGSGGSIGFAALHELLAPLLTYADALPQRQRAALDAVLGTGDEQPADRLVLALAVLGLVQEAAHHKPLLLIVEDLHWVDRSSADVFALLPRRLGNTRAALIATSRPYAEISDRERSFQTTQTLAALTADEAASVVAMRAPQLKKNESDLIVRASHGNPLALTEFIGTVRREPVHGSTSLSLTSRLEQAFLSEVSQLPHGSRRAVTLAAIGEQSSQGEIIAALRVIGLQAGDLAAAEQSRLVRAVNGRFVFRHPLLVSAIVGAADFAARAEVHKALAEVIHDPARRATHRAEAVIGQDDEVAAELDAAAERGFRRGAKAEAASRWQRAAELSTDAEGRSRRLALAAESSRQAGDATRTAQLLSEADAITSSSATQRQLARTDWMLSMTAAHSGRTTAQLVALARSAEETDAALEVLVWAAAKCWVQQEPEEVRLEVMRAAHERRGGSASLRAVLTVLVDPIRNGPTDALPQFLEEVDDTSAVLLNCLAFSAEGLEDLETAERYWTAGVQLFHSTGRVSDEVISICGRSTVRLSAGRVLAGIADAELALRLARDLNLPIVAGMAGAALARGRAMLGEREAAEAALAAVADEPGASTFARIEAVVAWARAILAADAGDHAAAVQELFVATAYPPISARATGDLIESLIRVGRLDVIDAWLAAVGTTDVSGFRVIAGRTRALTDEARAEEHFVSSVAAADGDGDAIEVARTRLAFGEFLRRKRRVIDAREQLAAALSIFESQGMPGLSRRARAELRAAGVRDAAGGIEATGLAAAALTPQELIVVRFAASGLSNKEIADEVYLSHRTVGAHLHRAFAKLGVSRRAQLSGIDGLQSGGEAA
ncbi:AAA family ATPase [Curtobacterium sp. MCBA15_008]|uniref:AAA family ATPase n=1 Tax=Curtobacterium sp. MCBA15_008 TaxID=1898736 RepID=UPI0015876CB6|nr:LuxR family transcriptional regulator [Curtobacterium sp. MCBA15_008]